MDPDEERRLGEKLEKLGMLGRDAGAGAGIWAQVIEDQLAHVDVARDRFLAKVGDGRDWDRFYGGALVIALAVGQVLAFEEQVCKVTGDAKLAEARREFDRTWPHARQVRDLVAHLDEYAVGGGLRQRTPTDSRHGAPIAPKPLRSVVYWTDTGEIYLSFANDLQNLHTLARDVTELATLVERTRARWVELTVAKFEER